MAKFSSERSAAFTGDGLNIAALRERRAGVKMNVAAGIGLPNDVVQGVGDKDLAERVDGHAALKTDSGLRSWTIGADDPRGNSV